MSDCNPSTPHHEALALLEELRARVAVVERLVAPKVVVSAVPAGDLPVLVIQVQDADAAIPLGAVLEVVPYVWLTPIPEAPMWVAGLLDLGGRMLCVLDVEARVFGKRHCPRAADFIVICQVQEQLVGLCVHNVREVVTFAARAVAPPPPDVPYASYLLGTISHGRSPILLFSVDLLLHSSDLPAVPEWSK